MTKTFQSLIFILVCGIISINALRSITNSYSLGTVYVVRKQQTEKQYLELVKKKNELDYINSPFFVEKQLRESLNYYKSGESLLVFTHPLTTPEKVAETEDEQKNALQQWLEFLKFGIKGPLDN